MTQIYNYIPSSDFRKCSKGESSGQAFGLAWCVSVKLQQMEPVDSGSLEARRTLPFPKEVGVH
jgi:hypothetical protein